VPWSWKKNQRGSHAPEALELKFKKKKVTRARKGPRSRTNRREKRTYIIKGGNVRSDNRDTRLAVQKKQPCRPASATKKGRSVGGEKEKWGQKNANIEKGPGVVAQKSLKKDYRCVTNRFPGGKKKNHARGMKVKEAPLR